jgi:hypothetical protein
MDTKLPVNPLEIHRLLTDVARDTYNGLIHGSMKVREYFEAEDKNLNAPLAANIARYHAKEFVASRRSLGTPYLLKDVPNNGIAVRQDWFDIKVLKGRDGKPPSPSKSKRSEKFYSQTLPEQRLLFPDMHRAWASDDWPLFAEQSQTLNLILCWEVDSRKYGQAVKLFWRVPILNPAQGITGLYDVNSVTEDLDDLEIQIDETEVNWGND